MNVNEPRLELDETHYFFFSHSDSSNVALYTRVQLRFVTALHRGLVYQLRSQHPKVGSSYADRIPFNHDCSKIKLFFRMIYEYHNEYYNEYHK